MNPTDYYKGSAQSGNAIGASAAFTAQQQKAADELLNRLHDVLACTNGMSGDVSGIAYRLSGWLHEATDVTAAVPVSDNFFARANDLVDQIKDALNGTYKAVSAIEKSV